MSSPTLALQNAHMSYLAFSHQLDQWKSKVLGAICFSGLSMDENSVGITDVPVLQVLTPVLDGSDAACEVWLGNANLTQEQCGAIRYRYDDEMLFGVIELPETEQAPVDMPPLQQAAELAYRQILMLLDDLNYPFMYRFWNYMADINGVSHGLERYRQFNLGRQEAFLACGRGVEGDVPAACALGTAHGPLTIAFLAGRTPSLAVENPRQISAYQYPEQYGPRSPTFSRASLLRLPQEEILFISGTASIVGHETQHQADVIAQTRETLANLEAVIFEANRLASKPEFNLAHVFFRVYVRYAADMPLIREEMERIIGATVKAVFLQADICREDLLVEIEITAGHSFELIS